MGFREIQMQLFIMICHFIKHDNNCHKNLRDRKKNVYLKKNDHTHLHTWHQTAKQVLSGVFHKGHMELQEAVKLIQLEW